MRTWLTMTSRQPVAFIQEPCDELEPGSVMPAGSLTGTENQALTQRKNLRRQQKRGLCLPPIGFSVAPRAQPLLKPLTCARRFALDSSQQPRHKSARIKDPTRARGRAR